MTEKDTMPEFLPRFGLFGDYKYCVRLPWGGQPESGGALSAAELRRAKQWLKSEGYVYDMNTAAYWKPVALALYWKLVASRAGEGE